MNTDETQTTLDWRLSEPGADVEIVAHVVRGAVVAIAKSWVKDSGERVTATVQAPFQFARLREPTT